MTRQIPSLILPTVAPLPTSVETVADLITHVSLELDVDHLRSKIVQIIAIEVVVAGVPGNLHCWIELSPYLTTTSATFWAAIGGGGGVLPPVLPVIEGATGVPGRVHSIILPWTIHSTYARLVVQTPVAAGLPGNFWRLQAVFGGRS